MKRQLIEEAKRAREQAYTIYSKFKVGAALLGKSGTIYTGCNIENASYSLTCCAERVVIFKAISSGEIEFKAMAITGDTEEVISPCGACRQVMAEFFDDQVMIYLTNLQHLEKETSINELLPHAFGL